MALYCDPDASGANNGGSWTDAIEDVQTAFDTVTKETGPLYIRKSGGGAITVTAPLRVDTIAGTYLSKIRIIGCNAAGVADMSRLVLDAGGAAINIVEVDIQHISFENIRFTNTSGSGYAMKLEDSGDHFRMFNCEMDNAYHGLVETPNNSTAGLYVCCDFHDNRKYGVQRACTYGLWVFCNFYDNALDGCYSSYITIFYGCAFFRNGNSGYDNGTSHGRLIHCVSDNNQYGYSGGYCFLIGCKATNNTAALESGSTYGFEVLGLSLYGNDAQYQTNAPNDYFSTIVDLVTDGYEDFDADDFVNAERMEMLVNLGVRESVANWLHMGIPAVIDPRISDVSPAEANAGDTLTITGMFDGASTVTVGGISATIGSQDVSEIQVAVPVGLEAGTNQDVVVTDANGNTHTAPNAVLIGAVTPVAIARVQPTSVSVDGGTTVTVHCRNAGDDQGTGEVYLEDADGTLVAMTATAWTDTYVQFSAPAQVAGAYDVKLVTDGGSQDTLTDAVTYASSTMTAPTDDNEWSFYSVASTSNKVLTFTALYSDIYCEKQVETVRRSEQEGRGTRVERYRLFPERKMSGIKYGIVVVSSDERFYVEYVEEYDDHQEIVVTKVNDA